MHNPKTEEKNTQAAKLAVVINKISTLTPEELSILTKMLAVSVPMQPWSKISSEQLEYAKTGFDTLTPREKQVLQEILSGNPNKVAARQLNISPRTIEVHRSRIMQKMGARNIVDLCNLYSAIAGNEGSNR